MSPKNVRPVWVEVESDARSTGFGTGPRARDGQATVNIKVRDEGRVLDLLEIEGIGSGDEQTVLIRITDKRSGSIIFEERFNQ